MNEKPEPNKLQVIFAGFRFSEFKTNVIGDRIKKYNI
jgi:hypothetical protein